MFFAYPNKPGTLEQTIESAINKVNSAGGNIKSWKALDIMGAFIADKIETTIEERRILIADISILNFNVTYEIGYAIGLKIPLLLVKNQSLSEPKPGIREVGIFDTIGYKEYSNSTELAEILLKPETHVLLNEVDPNLKAPVYLLETKYKTDFSTRISARIKKAGYIYRSFDPNESPRLPANDAINQVAQSCGIVVPLLSRESEDHEIHNLRAAFVAGLAQGMDKPLCLLQYGSDPIPLDYRDLVNVYNGLSDINEHIASFIPEIVSAIQGDKKVIKVTTASILQTIDLGASSAENEMRTLQYYYMKTDAYQKVARGESQLVVGRKGSGKSAIFLQLRDKEREHGNNIVLDLKPDGYKLIKFKEQILNFMEEGTLQHTITAFWEYILLLEICHKILDHDKKKYKNQTELFRPYVKLEDLFKAEEYLTEGDFLERMSRLMDNLTVLYKEKHGMTEKVRLSAPQITELIYKNDIRKLRTELMNYLKFKEKIWVLFDNIDKGWPSNGLTKEDIIIIRSLIDASRTIQREFGMNRINMFPVVFLRNDVYELLVNETSDKQKEAKVLLDWVDTDLLKELIRLRVVANINYDHGTDFSDIWRSICTSHYEGEETFQYLIERSLMRPRFLINLINQCKSSAINLNHGIIEPGDIKKGVSLYSVDLLTDIGYEIRDILPEAENVLYGFIKSNKEFSSEKLHHIVSQNLKDYSLCHQVVDLLLWYGFLGVSQNNGDTTYIYTMKYNMQLFKGLINKGNVSYVINPAFWPALMME